MSEAYWRHNDSRHPDNPSLPSKRPRSDYDVPSGRERAGYYREDDGVSHRSVRDTESINQSYDNYLRSGQVPYAAAESGRLHGSGYPVDDPRMGSDTRMGSDHRMGSDPRMGSNPRMGTDPRMLSDHRMVSSGDMDPGMPVKGRGSGRSEVSLPPDASSTLFVEGLPSNCTRREVAHIFRPFVGYREVRLVTKDSRHPRGDPLVLCFVDFLSPAHAATAMDALQGYKFDENDHDTAILGLQFARYPGARSGGGHRSKR